MTSLLSQFHCQQSIQIIQITIHLKTSFFSYPHHPIHKIHHPSINFITYSPGELWFLIFIALHHISSLRDILTTLTVPLTPTQIQIPNPNLNPNPESDYKPEPTKGNLIRIYLKLLSVSLSPFTTMQATQKQRSGILIHLMVLIWKKLRGHQESGF